MNLFSIHLNKSFLNLITLCLYNVLRQRVSLFVEKYFLLFLNFFLISEYSAFLLISSPFCSQLETTYTSAYYLSSYILFQVYLATLTPVEDNKRLPKLTNPVTLPFVLFSSIIPFWRVIITNSIKHTWTMNTVNSYNAITILVFCDQNLSEGAVCPIL